MEDNCYIVSGFRLEDVDGCFMDMPFEEEFETFEEMKRFVLKHRHDLYVSIDEIVSPDGEQIESALL